MPTVKLRIVQREVTVPSSVSYGQLRATRLILFNHGPVNNDDIALARIEQDAAARAPGCAVAREGSVIKA